MSRLYFDENDDPVLYRKFDGSLGGVRVVKDHGADSCFEGRDVDTGEVVYLLWWGRERGVWRQCYEGGRWTP